MVSAAISGTASAAINEVDIVTGGKTIIITLTGDTWVTAGVTFDAVRQDIINGLTSAQAEAAGWNAVVKLNEVVASVVRTSNTVVTITLSAHATYDITAQETITATIPASALTLSAVNIIGAPTISIDASVIVCDATGFYSLLGTSSARSWNYDANVGPWTGSSNSKAILYFGGGASSVDFTTGLDIDFYGPGQHRKLFGALTMYAFHNGANTLSYGIGQEADPVSYASLGFAQNDACIVFVP